jgi:uncharacterized protein
MDQAQPSTYIPVQESERIISLDVMRGVVLLGILLMNINGFGLAHAYSNPTVAGGYTGLNLYTWMTTNMFFEGTMRALFSLLFGVGMFIFLDRLVKRGDGIHVADIFFRRLLWLLVFGLIHGYLLLWTGEILFDYALMGFIVYSFRYMSPRKLIRIAFFLLAIGALWSYFDFKGAEKMLADAALADTYTEEGKELTKDMKEARFKWDEIQEDISPKAIGEFNESMRKGYFSVVAFLAPHNMETDTEWPYRWDLWDILSMMLIGIALYKWNIFSGEHPVRVYGAMVFFGYLIGLTVNYFELQTILNSQFSFLAFTRINITYDLGRIPIAIGHIGMIMLFCKANILTGLKRRLAAVGKMALTNYLMHSIICMIFFTGVGFAQFGKLERFELLYVVFSIWVFQLIVSPIWLRYYHYGPMEWLWRTLSYQKMPPFRKRIAGMAATERAE